MNSILINQSEIFPSKVVCIGRNYVDHIKELNNETPDSMVFFLNLTHLFQKVLFFLKEIKVVIMRLRYLF